MPENGDTAWYNLTNLHAQEYRLELIPKQMEQIGVKTFLLDRFLHTLTLLTVTDTLKYTFSVNASMPGSFAPDRFCLIFKKAKKSFEIQNFNAELVNGITRLQWVGVNVPAGAGYQVQSSEDGVHFINADAHIEVGNQGMMAEVPASGFPATYYRVVGMKDREWASSEARKLSMQGSISIYPNPINNGVANITLSNLEAGMYQLELIDAAGQIVIRKAIPISLQQKRIQLSVNELGAGTFLLQLKGSREVFSQKLVIVK